MSGFFLGERKDLFFFLMNVSSFFLLTKLNYKSQLYTWWPRSGKTGKCRGKKFGQGIREISRDFKVFQEKIKYE